jgi:putative Holliday junction resolvase
MSEQGSKESKQFSINESRLAQVGNLSFPILAIDYGDKRVGIAISDSKGIVSTPLEVLSTGKKRTHLDIINDIAEIIKEQRVKSILLGLPQSFVESHEEAQHKIIEFSTELESVTELNVYFYDESFSTASAQNMLLSVGQNTKSTKYKIDKVSAAYFLQEFLDKHHS